MKSQTLLLPGLGLMGKSPGLSEHRDQTLLTQLPPRVKSPAWVLHTVGLGNIHC